MVTPMPAAEAPAPERAAALRRGAFYAAAWTVQGLFFFSQDVSRNWYWNDPTPTWRFLLSWMISVWLLAALTPAMLWVGRRFPLDARGWLRRLPVHLLASVVTAVGHVAASSALVPPTGALVMVLAPAAGYWRAFEVMLVIGAHGAVLSYWMVIGIQHGYRAVRRAQERGRAALRLEAQAATLEAQAATLAAQLSSARLSTLKGQLQPHFLFNTLNAIAVLVRQRQVELAEDTLGRLADLLRLVLDDATANEVSLRRELDYLERYLAIEQLRFADRLRVEIEAEPACLGAALPHMGLQPLVENAIRHGIGQRVNAGLLRVRAQRRDDELRVTVEDDGPGPSGAGAGGRGGAAGIGLANTRARLQQLYGEAASLTLAARLEGGAVATLVVPFHLAAELPS